MRQHDTHQRLTWRKLHLAVDAGNHEVIAAQLTVAFVGDAEALPALLDQPPSEASVAADGAYDTQGCHQAMLDCQANALIPPHATWPPLAKNSPHPRTKILENIQQDRRKAWKQQSDYHRHNLVETAIFRLKTLFGSPLKKPSHRHPDHRSLCQPCRPEHHDPASYAGGHCGRGCLGTCSIGFFRLQPIDKIKTEKITDILAQ